jgi:adenine-specific DNA-methyltransferase
MASMFSRPATHRISLLEPGAGVGSLAAAFIERTCADWPGVTEIRVTAYEIDPDMCQGLTETLRDCAETASAAGKRLTFEIRNADFISLGSRLARGDLFHDRESFTHVLMNPPYRKVQSSSAHREQLRSCGIEATNLYSGFVALALKLLEPHGELVAITPRSFCNGPYFEDFRKNLLSTSALRGVHAFQSRSSAFKEDRVLQENIIFSIAMAKQPRTVRLSSSDGIEFSGVTWRQVPYSALIHSNDSHCLIHLPMSADDERVGRRLAGLSHSLDDLGLKVSTGPVVDFRLREFLRQEPGPATVPLLYPSHFRHGALEWPKAGGRKPNAIVSSDDTRKWLMPTGYYTVTRRFSSKEERRRVVASVLDPTHLPSDLVGIENHLNVFHRGGQGLDPTLARGLAAFLNSTIVDQVFRTFNGHTQVNASDLRALRYPGVTGLKALGRRVGRKRLNQEELDRFLDELLAASQDAA